MNRFDDFLLSVRNVGYLFHGHVNYDESILLCHIASASRCVIC